MSSSKPPGFGTASEGKAALEVTAVLLCGVPVEDRKVLQIAGLVDQRLGSKLVTAYRLRHGVVALNVREREEIIAALEDPPAGLEELRATLLQEHAWRQRESL